MRHKYLDIKQNIQALSPHSFNWSDGLSHLEKFLYHEEVFGDIPSSSLITKNGSNFMISLQSLGFLCFDDDIIDPQNINIPIVDIFFNRVKFNFNVFYSRI